MLYEELGFRNTLNCTKALLYMNRLEVRPEKLRSRRTESRWKRLVLDGHDKEINGLITNPQPSIPSCHTFKKGLKNAV